MQNKVRDANPSLPCLRSRPGVWNNCPVVSIRGWERDKHYEELRERHEVYQEPWHTCFYERSFQLHQFQGSSIKEVCSDASKDRWGKTGLRTSWEGGRTIWFLVHGRWKLGGWSFSSCVWLDVAEGFTYSWTDRPQVHSSAGPSTNAHWRTAVADWHFLTYRRLIFMFNDAPSKPTIKF